MPDAGGVRLEMEASPIVPLSLSVLSRHLLRQIVLTEPLRIACFLPATMAANEMSLVQITAHFLGLGYLLYGIFQGVIVGIIFSGKYRTFSDPHSHKSESPSARFRPNQQRLHRPYARNRHRQKRYPSSC